MFGIGLKDGLVYVSVMLLTTLGTAWTVVEQRRIKESAEERREALDELHARAKEQVKEAKEAESS